MFELREHAIHGRETNLVAGLIEFTVDILGTEMMLGALLEQAQYLQPRRGYLESGLLEILTFRHDSPLPAR